LKVKTKSKWTQLSEVIASLEVIEVKGVNDNTQSMKIRNDGSPLRLPQGGGSAMRGVSMEDGRWMMYDG